MIELWLSAGTKHSYFFAEIPLVWGWATWRKAWQHFQYNVPDIDNEVFSNLAKKPWQKVILDTFENKIDSWAYRWIYSYLRLPNCKPSEKYRH